MKEILVVNELPADVFSEHLLGKGYAVRRLAFSSALTEFSGGLIEPEIVLMVNESRGAAIKVKEASPSSWVLSVNGGKKNFTPFVTITREEYDRDCLIFRSWEEFESFFVPGILETMMASFRRILKYSSSDRQYDYYQAISENLPAPVKRDNHEFNDFIRAMVFLSQHYLEWLSVWAQEASQLSIPVKLSFGRKRGKKIRVIVVPLKNYHRGLPILKEGDKVSLELGGVSELGADVISANESEAVLKLNGSAAAAYLETAEYLHFDPFALRQRLFNLHSQGQWFKNLMDKPKSELDFFSSQPVKFFADCIGQSSNNGRSATKPKVVGFTSESEKIMRDSSQVAALLDFLGPEFFTLIIGPAATGKTFLTAVASQQIFCHSNKVIMIVSQSNLGVDTVLVEAAKYIDNKYIFRFGNDTSAISSEALRFHCRQRYESGLFGKTSEYGNPRIAEKRFISSRFAEGQGLVFGCTLDSFLWVCPFLKSLGISIDIVINDEASRGLFPEILPAIIAAREKVVFIGDNRQLGSLDLPREAVDYLQEKIDGLPEGYDWKKTVWPKPIVHYFSRGFFNSLIELGYLPSNLLEINRRSLKDISELVSQVFYGGALVTGRFNPYSQGEISFIAARFPEERSGTSYINPGEAALVVKRFIRQAIRHLKDPDGRITDLVIISPYMAQVRLLKKKLRKHLLFHEAFRGQVNPENIDAILDQIIITVDAIQGGQRKIVFISLVRSNDEHQIGFNHDIRRLNVALSRAQESLTIIGNPDPFLSCDYPDIRSAFGQIIERIKAKGKYEVIG